MQNSAEHGTPARADHPLRGLPHPFDRLHPGMYAAEMAGTALMVAGGLSVVIAMFGNGSPLAGLAGSDAAQRAITGFLFGSIGALVCISPLGKVSGSHINPAVTFAFWLEGKIAWRDALGYVLAQIAGGVLGALPLLWWGSWGSSVAYGATVPAADVAIWWPVLGEAICTYLLVTMIFVMAAHRPTQPWLPYASAPLFSLLVCLEAPLSGTSANPARSIGPALITGDWGSQWVYVAGPCLGAALAVGILRFEAFRHHRPHEARRVHFSLHLHMPHLHHRHAADRRSELPATEPG